MGNKSKGKKYDEKKAASEQKQNVPTKKATGVLLMGSSKP